MPRSLVLLGLTALAACSGKPTDDTAGVDSGINDSDSGGDTGKPPPPVYVALDGTVTYFEAVNGLTTCDLDVALTGTPYTGDCYDCAFAFNIDAEITRDDSPAGCVSDPRQTFLESDQLGFHDMFMFMYSTYESGPYVYYNMLITGYSYTYGTYDYPGPYYFVQGYGGGYFGRTAFRNNELTLDFYYYAPSYISYVGPYYDGCGDKIEVSTETTNRGGESYTGRIGCDGLTADLWTFDVQEGANFALAVDTLSADSTFSPELIVNDPDGCSVILAKDNFLCSYPPPTYLCPAYYQAGAAGGTWTVSVLNQHACSSTSADYVLYVDGGTNVRLQADDYAAFSRSGDSYLRTVQMTATLTEE